MCLRQTSQHPEAQKLRRTGVTLAASCGAISGSSVALFAGHHNPILYGCALGLDLVLLTIAVTLVCRAKRLEREL